MPFTGNSASCVLPHIDADDGPQVSLLGNPLPDLLPMQPSLLLTGLTQNKGVHIPCTTAP